MHITLQSTVGDFDASFKTALRKFETVMTAKALDPSVYVISKDRPQFTSLPFFVRPSGDGYTYTLQEIGRIFSVTRERVRQIETESIRKLQYPGPSRKLAAFVDHSLPSLGSASFSAGMAVMQ